MFFAGGWFALAFWSILTPFFSAFSYNCYTLI
jgi:hypothetical protein